MPAVGRKVSISKDIRKYATDEFEKTFYTSPANNTCFYSKCMYYCNIFHPVCGQGDELEGSLNAYMPTFKKGGVRVCRFLYYPLNISKIDKLFF